MVEFLLKQEIERRVFEEIGATGYFSETAIVRILSPVHYINLENALYFLLNKAIEIPVTARVSLKSPDNLLVTSKQDYQQFNAAMQQSFRNHLTVTTEDYGATFIPFTLEFLKVTPQNSKEK